MSEATEQTKELPAPYQKRLVGDEIKYLRTALHPTNRAEAKDITRRILRYMAERPQVTSKEVQEALSLSETTVLKRLQVFREFKLVRKEQNKLYVVGPRLREFVKLYMGRM